MVTVAMVRALLSMFAKSQGKFRQAAGAALVHAVRELVGPLVSESSAESLTANEICLARHGQKVQAIKSVRDRTGLGLAESKKLVEEAVPNCAIGQIPGYISLHVLNTRLNSLDKRHVPGGYAVDCEDLANVIGLQFSGYSNTFKNPS